MNGLQRWQYTPLRWIGLCPVLVLGLTAGCAGRGVPMPGERTAIPDVQPTASPKPQIVRGTARGDRANAPAFTEDQSQRIAAVRPLVDGAARRHAVDPDLINAVIWVESRFQARAKSPAGARGLMQLMPATAGAMARSMGRRRANPYDPKFNIDAGTLYLAKLRTKFDGDDRLALASYNAGSGNVQKWIAGDGLPEHSEKYVASVMAARQRFAALRDASLPESERPTRIAKVQTKPEPKPPVLPPAHTGAIPEPASEAAPVEPAGDAPPVGSPKPPAPAQPAPEPDPAIPAAAEPPTTPATTPAPTPPAADPPREPVEVGIGRLPSVLDIED